MSPLQSSPLISPFLWFNDQAGEAADFYVSVFPNSRRTGQFNPPTEGPWPKDKPLVVTFELDGLKFTALNGGPAHKFTEAISFVVRCKDQKEIDYYWDKLAEGGSNFVCGWLKDKFGLSWQIVPERMSELISNPHAMQAMMGMQKLDIATLENAGKS